MRRKNNRAFRISLLLILFVLLAAYLVAQRSFRTIFALGIFVLLVFTSVYDRKSTARALTGVGFSVLLTLALLLSEAPGIMKPAFQTMEKMRFALVRPVYEKDALRLKEELANEERLSLEALPQTENHLKFLASTVMCRKKDDQLMLVYVTEWDRLCGYAWISDESCREWVSSLAERWPAGEGWYYVRIY